MTEYTKVLQAKIDRDDNVETRAGVSLPMIVLELTTQTQDHSGQHPPAVRLFWMEPAHALQLSMAMASVLRKHFPELFTRGAPSA